MMDDARTKKKNKILQQGSQRRGHSRLSTPTWLSLMLLIITAPFFLGVGASQAEGQPLPAMTVNYQQGEITALHEKTLDIDGRTYGLTPDVVLLDEYGEEMDPARLMVTAEVKFHVKKEQSDKIDKMIVTLPK